MAVSSRHVSYSEIALTLGPGLGFAANCICIGWTLFITVIFSMPTLRPVTKDNMNYAAVITVGVLVLSLYVFHGRTRTLLLSLTSLSL